MWNSKQHRQRTSRSAAGDGGPNCPSGGNSNAAVAGAAAVVAAAGSSCPGSNTAAAAAAAPATRVKSRISSSFSVQCATTPKVATVAVFFPPTALEAACQAAAGGDDCVGLDCFPAAAAVGGRRGKKGVDRVRGCRGGSHGSSSMPSGDHRHAEVSNGGDDGDGVIQTRRRWSFAGQARFGAAGAGVGARAKTKPHVGLLLREVLHSSVCLLLVVSHTLRCSSSILEPAVDQLGVTKYFHPVRLKIENCE